MAAKRGHTLKGACKKCNDDQRKEAKRDKTHGMLKPIEPKERRSCTTAWKNDKPAAAKRG